jgi:DNA-binding transcriptional LysR family regulator
MDLKQLRALLAVAETGSATKASDVLCIVQPAVSRHIKLLEEEFGVELFARGPHGMVLTDAGRTLVEHGRRALTELDRARAEMQPTPGSISGVASLGLLPSSCELLASELVVGVRDKHPRINVRLTVGYAGHLIRWLEAGEVEAALLYDLKPTPGLEVEALLDEQLFLVAPRGQVPKKRQATIEMLRNVPTVLPNAPHGLRNVVEHACALAGISLNVVAETNSLKLQKNLVAQGFGWTILPSCAISEEIALGTLAGIPFTQPTLTRRIVLAHSATRRPSVAASFAMKELVALMKRLASSGGWPGATWIGR